MRSLDQSSGKLEMLGLVLTDWNNASFVEENIGCHEHRVGEEGQGCFVFIGALIFKLGHPVEPGERAHARE